MALVIGSKAPDFILPSTNGHSFQLNKDLKDKACVLYFYPKDFTRGCTKEACEFRDHFSYFDNLDIDIIGISRDDIKTHERFKNKLHLPFELLSDSEGIVTKKYKASVPLLGITRRITYLLDKDHNVAAVYENMLGASKHIQQMVKEVKS